MKLEVTALSCRRWGKMQHRPVFRGAVIFSRQCQGEAADILFITTVCEEETWLSLISNVEKTDIKETVWHKPPTTVCLPRENTRFVNTKYFIWCLLFKQIWMKLWKRQLQGSIDKVTFSCSSVIRGMSQNNTGHSAVVFSGGQWTNDSIHISFNNWAVFICKTKKISSLKSIWMLSCLYFCCKFIFVHSKVR